MDLVEKIERSRFLGREFLTWLWFESEVLGGELSVPGLGLVGIGFEKQIVLSSEPDTCSIKAAEPTRLTEAHEALRQGKLPVSVSLRVTTGERSFALRVTADSRAFSSVAIPKLVREEEDEQFYERMYAIEELEGILDTLYATFLTLRASHAWADQVAPAMRTWALGGDVDVTPYRALRQKARPPKVFGAGAPGVAPASAAPVRSREPLPKQSRDRVQASARKRSAKA